jgi:hypothetical protein
MERQAGRSWTAFEGLRCIASGEPAQVASETKLVVDRGEQAPVLIFDDTTGEQVEIDFRGTADEVVARLPEQRGESTSSSSDESSASETPRGPGRPKLGVVAREVTLLPRHWDWLNSQSGGASVALRKLVDEARRMHEVRDRIRRSQEAAYRVMSALAGNLTGFEEASRALFARDPVRFIEQTCGWPKDVQDYLSRLIEDGMRTEREAPARATAPTVN